MRYHFHLALFFLIAIPSFSQNCLNLDGLNDYVLCSSPGPVASQARTVEAWVKTSFTGTQRVILDWGEMAPLGSRYTLNMIQGNLRIEVGGNGMTVTSPTINDGQWHHVAASFDPLAGLQHKLYIDGVMVLNQNLTVATNTAATTGVIIGRRNNGVNYWSGEIDEVRIWNTVRSDLDILNSYQDKVCQGTPNLLYYYDFDQGTAGGTNTADSILRDRTSSLNNGSLRNFSLSGPSSNWMTGQSLNDPVLSTSFSETSCGPYTSPSGQIWDSTGIYFDTLSIVAGCDSTYTINLTVFENSSSSIQTTTCDSLISPSGNQVWYTTGIYTDTLTNAVGCDSIITVDLSKIEPDTGVTVIGNTLFSNQSDAQYQWYRCQGGVFTAIAGATDSVYTLSQSSFYGVEVTYLGCTDTSSCQLYFLSGLQGGNAQNLSFFPNPASNRISLSNTLDVKIWDLQGELLIEELEVEALDLSELNKGLYFIELRLPNSSLHAFKKLIVRD